MYMGVQRDRERERERENMRKSTRNLPTASVMKEPWEDKVRRVKSSSPYGHIPNWSIPHII